MKRIPTRSLNNSGVTLRLADSVKLNLFNNLGRAIITEFDLIFK